MAVSMPLTDIRFWQSLSLVSSKESVVQPQLNLQDEFASPEKALDEEEQRR